MCKKYLPACHIKYIKLNIEFELKLDLFNKICIENIAITISHSYLMCSCDKIVKKILG